MLQLPIQAWSLPLVQSCSFIKKSTKKRETINTPRKHFSLKTLIGNFPPQAAKPAMHLSSEQIIVYQIYQSQTPICLIFFPILNVGYFIRKK